MTDDYRGRGQRVLAIHRYFWPDQAPYAVMLKRIVEQWAADGHDVHVLSSQPAYKETTATQKCPETEVRNGVRIRRLNLAREIGRPVRRILNAMILAIAVIAYAIRHGRFDAIMISTAPPVIGGAAAAVAARLTGARLIYHCMDIHPEIGRLSGEFRNRWVFATLRRLDSWTCRTAWRVIVLSRDMRRSILDRPGIGKVRFATINNFVLPGSDDAGTQSLPPGLEKDPNRLRLIFAGNIGRFQNLDVVLEAFEQLRQRDDIECVFLGEGAAKPSLQQRVARSGDKRIHFYPHQPADVAFRAIQAADLGLVMLDRSIYRYAFPSKTMTYLQAGRPILVSIELESELALLVQKENAGFAVAPDDPAAMAAVIAAAASDRDAWPAMEENARRLAAEQFAEDVVLQEWSRFLARDIQ